MFNNLTIFQTAGALSQYAARSHATIAENIAQADTPGYKTQRMRDFSDAFARRSDHMRMTRPGHLDGQSHFVRFSANREASHTDPNGNNVSLEREMVASAMAQRDHDKALAIYRHGMTLLRTSLGRN